MVCTDDWSRTLGRRRDETVLEVVYQKCSAVRMGCELGELETLSLGERVVHDKPGCRWQVELIKVTVLVALLVALG
jgi:hypothetical protein